MSYNSIIIGLGNIGLLYDKEEFNIQDSYLTHTKALHYLDEFNLIAGVDINKNNRKLFNSLTGKESYSSILLLKDKIKKVDLCVISSPTYTHLSIIEEVLYYLNPSVILCEKPLSYNLLETEKIMQICKTKNTELFINFPRRLEKSVNIIKSKLINDSFIKGLVWYSNGMINNGIHFIDLLSHLLGKSIEVYLLKINHIYRGQRNDFDIDFKIVYDKGEVYFLSSREDFFSNYKVEILSNNNRYIIDNNGFKSKLNRVINDPKYKGFKCLSSDEINIDNNLVTSITLVYDDILNYLNNKTSILNDQDKIKEVHSVLDELTKQTNEKISK